MRASRALRTAASLRRGVATAAALPVRVHNPGGQHRVVVTKDLPGTRWLDILQAANCRVEVCSSTKTILSVADIKALLGTSCQGVIGQLTERWDQELFGALRAAGGRAYSNYAVGYDNVNVADATKAGIAVGNTPGVCHVPYRRRRQLWAGSACSRGAFLAVAEQQSDAARRGAAHSGE